MRITSSLFVAQLMRRVFAAGGFAAVERKGAEEAGAIFIVQRGRDRSLVLYGPASQSAVEDGATRLFMREGEMDEEALARRFEREGRFDPDFWVVEIEAEEPQAFFAITEG